MGDAQTGPAGDAECPDELPDFVERSTTQAGVALACNVVLGQEGSDIEQGLEAARRAIEGNAPFLREDARLVLVFFSDEDDCTAQLDLDRSEPNNCVRQQDALVGAADFGRYFARSARGFAGNPVSVVAIVGPRDDRAYESGVEPEASCEALSSARSGNRYIEMTETEGIARYGFFESICATSFLTTVERIIDEAVAIPDDEVCVSLPMTTDPQAVLVKADTSDAGEELSELGEYLALGSTDTCETGAVAVSTGAHDEETGHVIEVRFCTDVDPSAE